MDILDAEKLAREFGQQIYRFAFVRTGNRSDAEDMTQETFLRLVRAAPTFPDEQRYDKTQGAHLDLLDFFILRDKDIGEYIPFARV